MLVLIPSADIAKTKKIDDDFCKANDIVAESGTMFVRKAAAIKKIKNHGSFEFPVWLLLNI